MPGKKGKKTKTKGVSLSLGEFLGEGGAPINGNIVSKQVVYEDDDNLVNENLKVFLPSCPRTSMGTLVDESKIPTSGPFTVKISNLPFDVEEPEIRAFFSDLEIDQIKLPMSADGVRFKGYGYVEFPKREHLIEALGYADEMIRTRKINVELPDHSGRDGDRRTGGYGDRRGYGDRGDRGGEEPEDRSGGISDWRATASAPLPPRSEGRFGGGGGSRYDDDRRDRGGSRYDDDRRDRGGSRYDDDRRDRGGFGGSSRSDDEPWRRGPPADGERRGGGGGFEDRRGGRGGFDDRHGGYENRGGGGYENRGGGFGDRRRDYDDRGGGGFGDRRRDYDDRGGRGGFGDRRRDYEDRREGYDDRRESSPPRERQRLQLKPRTVEPSSTSENEPSNKSSIFGDARPVDTKERPSIKLAKTPREAVGSSSADIFGAAKPVDTTSKDLEIEKKVQKKFERAVEKTAPKPSNADIFGAAKPVDTLAREREIEEKLMKHPAGSDVKIPSKDGRRREERFRDDRRPRIDKDERGSRTEKRNGEGLSKRNDRSGSQKDRVEETDEERFLRDQPRLNENTETLDMRNKFGNLDLEQEI